MYIDIQEGYRHPKPDRCPDGIYKLMLSCWNGDPVARPSFAKLHSMLQQFNVDEDRLYDELCLFYLII